MKYAIIAILFATHLSVADELDKESAYVIIHKWIDEDGEEIDD